MKRILGSIALTFAAIVATAAPAFAHAELDKDRVEAGKEIDLTLEVPVEIPGERNVKVVVELPSGFAFRNCIATGNWACTLSQAANPTRDVVTWEPAAGITTGVESFTFRVQAREANGNVPFQVNQFYSNGRVVNWDGAATSDNPAPIVTVFGGRAPDSSEENVKLGSGEEPGDHDAPVTEEAQEQTEEVDKADEAADQGEEMTTTEADEEAEEPTEEAPAPELDMETKDAGWGGLAFGVIGGLMVVAAAFPLIAAGGKPKGGHGDGHGDSHH